MSVLILGSAQEDHAAHVRAQLETLGIDVEFLDSRDFPAAVKIAFDPATAAGSILLSSGQRLNFDEIHSVYWRSYGGISPADLPDEEQAFIAANDSRSLFESLLIHLPARWVNSYRAYRLHQTKPVQLAMVAALGVRVPATVIANDAEAIREFAGSHPHCIFKPVQGGAHTRPLSANQLTAEALGRLAIAPVTVQEEILGVDVRVFVAGDDVLACEIQTDAVDFRDDDLAELTAIELPASIADDCRRIARALDLLFTGIDLRRTPDGEHVFLEANPSPMFIGFEQRTGLPLTSHLCRLLSEKVACS